MKINNVEFDYGELRLNKCKKYDLGSGYRLICVKQGKHLIPLYVGTHDDCDRWIEKHRRLQPVINEESRKVFFIQEKESDEQVFQQELEPEMDYEDFLIEEIDEKTLRHVFRGLCKGKL